MAGLPISAPPLQLAVPSLTDPPKPFLKWAGGKRQLLKSIRPFYPERFETYFEPFVGSGAVFFDLYSRGLLYDKRTVLMDNNADLIGTYVMVRDHVDNVIRALRRFARQHKQDPEKFYYAVRDKRFNPKRKRAWNGRPPSAAGYTPSLAAMLIYLNRTGFNGLFRLNSRGMFNVPVGRYANPKICDSASLKAVSAALSTLEIEVVQDVFEAVRDMARPGDFVYFDPPYAPLSRTANFTSYTAGGFNIRAQQQLQRLVVDLARQGCKVLLSNSTAPEISKLYECNRDARAEGLRAYRVPAKRAINSNASARGAIDEYLITNISPR